LRLHSHTTRNTALGLKDKGPVVAAGGSSKGRAASRGTARIGWSRPAASRCRSAPRRQGGW
jgi:hypothetical protein